MPSGPPAAKLSPCQRRWRNHKTRGLKMPPSELGWTSSGPRTSACAVITVSSARRSMLTSHASVQRRCLGLSS